MKIKRADEAESVVNSLEEIEFQSSEEEFDLDNENPAEQLTSIQLCLEAKFARRSGSSSQFHWPNNSDVSVITEEQIHKNLPAPNIQKRGHFTFSLTFVCKL